MRPDGKKAIAALVLAVENNQPGSVSAMLDNGVPTGASDESRRFPLSIASNKGCIEIVRIFLQHGGLELEERDGDGKTALTCAVQQKHLPICKLLLSAGAKLPSGESCPGLSAVVQEVQIERLTQELKEAAQSTPDVTNELLEADGEVWKSMNEHCRLLRLREERKAGIACESHEAELRTESAELRRSRTSEEALASDLADLRITVQTVETAYALARQQLDAAELAAQLAVQEEAQADSEYKAMSAEIAKINAAKDEQERQYAQKVKERDDALSLASELTQEANAARSENKELSEELKTEAAAFRGWQRDQEMVAELTRKASSLLGPQRV